MYSILLTVVLTLCFGSLNGQCVDWSWVNSGTGPEAGEGSCVAVNPAGDIFFGGWFNSDTLLLSGVQLLNSKQGLSGSGDGFLSKYNMDGSLLWAKSFGGEDNSDWLWDIAAGPDGSVYGTGQYYSDTLFFGAGVYVLNSGTQDVFVAKWDSTGTIEWARGFGNLENEQVGGIAVDGTGNCYITGSFRDTIHHGSSVIVDFGGDDMYLATYDASGNPRWAVSVGDIFYEVGNNIAFDSENNIYVVGEVFSPSLSFATDTYISAGFGDMVLWSFDATGIPRWMIGAGGTASDIGSGVAVDKEDRIYLGASFFSSTMDFMGQTLSSSGDWDILVARLDTEGNLVWVRSDGSTDVEQTNGLDVDKFGTVWLGGAAGNAAFNVDTIVLDQRGIMLISFDSTGAALSGESFGGSTSQYDVGWDVAGLPSGGAMIAGEYNSSLIDIDGNILSSSSSLFKTDVFLGRKKSSQGPFVTLSSTLLNLCEGDSYLLEPMVLQSTGGLTHQWYKEGVPLTGATLLTLVIPTIALIDSGTYYLESMDSCGTTQSEDIEIQVHEIPASPVVSTTLSGDSIIVDFTGIITSVLWIYNGDTLPFTDIVIPNQGPGNYEVILINGPCSSDPGAMIVSGLNDPSLDPYLDLVKIYPNPSSNFIQIELPTPESGAYKLYGVSNIVYQHGSFWSQFSLDVTPYQPGYYLLEIITDKRRLAKPIIIN